MAANDSVASRLDEAARVDDREVRVLRVVQRGRIRRASKQAEHPLAVHRVLRAAEADERVAALRLRDLLQVLGERLIVGRRRGHGRRLAGSGWQHRIFMLRRLAGKRQSARFSGELLANSAQPDKVIICSLSKLSAQGVMCVMLAEISPEETRRACGPCRRRLAVGSLD